MENVLEGPVTHRMGCVPFSFLSALWHASKLTLTAATVSTWRSRLDPRSSRPKAATRQGCRRWLTGICETIGPWLAGLQGSRTLFRTDGPSHEEPHRRHAAFSVGVLPTDVQSLRQNMCDERSNQCSTENSGSWQRDVSLESTHWLLSSWHFSHCECDWISTVVDSIRNGNGIAPRPIPLATCNTRRPSVFFRWMVDENSKRQRLRPTI